MLPKFTSMDLWLLNSVHAAYRTTSDRENVDELRTRLFLLKPWHQVGRLQMYF